MKYQIYKVLKNEAKNNRASYLEEKVAEKAGDDNANAITILKTLMEHEKQREIGRRLRQILGRPHMGVTHVEAPNESGERITIC